MELFYDMIKQKFTNLEKGKILMYDLIKFNSGNGDDVITADVYLKNTSRYNLNKLKSIKLKSFPDDVFSVNIEVGSKYSSTWCNVKITKTENGLVFEDLLSYEEEETVYNTISDINMILNTKILFNNKTIIDAIKTYDNELSITVNGQNKLEPIDFIELTFDASLKEKTYVSPYVWVTPNTIDPRQHDMKIYDTRLNGILHTPEYGEILEYDFNDLKSKSSYLLPNLNLLTGQVTNGGDFQYGVYQEDTGVITIGNGQSTLTTCNDNQYNGKALFGPGIGHILDECIDQTMQTVISTNVWYLPWLGIKTKKLQEDNQIDTPIESV